ncbi:MAG: hypothetical protein WD749_02115 [Phycisphaerales bacterium]
MEKAKTWQIAIIAVAAVALAVSLFFTLRGDGVDLDSSLRMADVGTGEVFSLPIGKGPNAAMIPGKNPRTGEMTLLPIIEKDGRWFLRERYAVSLKSIQGSHAAVDEKTLEVRVK